MCREHVVIVVLSSYVEFARAIINKLYKTTVAPPVRLQLWVVGFLIFLDADKSYYYRRTTDTRSMYAQVKCMRG